MSQQRTLGCIFFRQITTAEYSESYIVKVVTYFSSPATFRNEMYTHQKSELLRALTLTETVQLHIHTYRVLSGKFLLGGKL